MEKIAAEKFSLRFRWIIASDNTWRSENLRLWFLRTGIVFDFYRYAIAYRYAMA
ncbi:MAG: hypothetical protein HY433_00760 [Candidatus Liptonbacteria bacterium]|nr:hypothetical protein [Candidatus Liptonbacteria bacterium]